MFFLLILRVIAKKKEAEAINLGFLGFMKSGYSTLTFRAGKL
jgi:hypothetical protein